MLGEEEGKTSMQVLKKTCGWETVGGSSNLGKILRGARYQCSGTSLEDVQYGGDARYVLKVGVKSDNNQDPNFEKAVIDEKGKVICQKSGKTFTLKDLEMDTPPPMPQGLTEDDASEVSHENSWQYFPPKKAEEILDFCRPGMV